MSQVVAMLTPGPLPPSRNRRSILRRVVGLLVVVVIIVGSAWGFAAVRSLAPPPAFTGGGTGSIVIVVNEGDSIRDVAVTLAGAGVVQSPEAFVNVAALDPRSGTISAGAYTLRLGMAAPVALELMLDPSSRAARLVLPEGLRLGDALDRLAAATGLPRATFDAALAEPAALGLPEWAKGRIDGFVYPATYDLLPGETATEVLARLVGRFDQTADAVELLERSEELGVSPYDVLIVASLVQAEAAPGDEGKVARVAWNRLEAGMPLQFDSTINYALGTSTLLITEDMLVVDSPYNTFTNPGLPPTPINSPGDTALEAALAPDRGDWLYFVTVNPQTGKTKFTADYDEFLEFKREFKRRYALQQQQAATQTESETDAP